jgi:hypothetical protein
MWVLGFLLDSLVVLINYYFSQLRDAISKARTFPQTKKNQTSEKKRAAQLGKTTA